MARRRGQHPNVFKTSSKRNPQWYFRYTVPVLVAPGVIKDKEQPPKYLGSVKSMGKRQAEKLRDEFLATINHVEALIPSQVAFSEVIRRYRALIVPTLKPNTQVHVEGQLAKHIEPDLAALRLCDIDPLTVQEWINGKAHLAPATRSHLLSRLRAILDEAAAWGMTAARNPAERIRIGQAGGKHNDLRALSTKELQRLISIAEDRDLMLANMIRVAAFCGLRIGEIRGLQWGDVKTNAIQIRRALSQQDSIETAPKSASGFRAVPLPFLLRCPLDSKDTDLAFPVLAVTASLRLRTAGARAGIAFRGFGWHTLRRTYATLMKIYGADRLRESMGHSRDEMTERYVRRSFADHAEVAERVVAAVKERVN